MKKIFSLIAIMLLATIGTMAQQRDLVTEKDWNRTAKVQYLTPTENDLKEGNYIEGKGSIIVNLTQNNETSVCVLILNVEPKETKPLIATIEGAKIIENKIDNDFIILDRNNELVCVYSGQKKSLAFKDIYSL